MTPELVRLCGARISDLALGVLWLPLWAYVELRAESGHDPSSELPCVLNPNLAVRIANGEATIPELEEP